MIKKTLLILLTFMSLSIYAQEDEQSISKIDKAHQFKFGASIQYDWGGGYYYYDDIYFGFYDHYYYYESSLLADYDGPNTQVFLAYEHIWTYPNRLAFGIEPKLGISFREYMKNGFVGANWKFYWLNKEIWRMGMFLYTGYEYRQSDKSMYVGMEGGMYQQRQDLKMNEHVMSFNLGLTAFQFKLRSLPILIECNANILGLHVFKTVSSKYKISETETRRLKYSETGGYGPRVELKVGWQLQ